MKTCRNIFNTVSILTAVLLSVLSCLPSGNGQRQSRREIVSLMDSAQHIMDENHISAMQFIIKVDPQYIHGHKLNARYALLYSEALNLNRITASDDSLIMLAVRYYSTSKDIDSQFRSYYTLGCIYDDLEQPANAAVAFSQAEQLADNISSAYQSGMLYSRMGKVYSKFFDYTHASQYFQKSIELFSQTDNEFRRISALYDLACCEIDLLDFETADTILLEVQQWASDRHDNRLLANSIVSRMTCALYGGAEEEELNSMLNSYLSIVGERKNDSRALGLLALYYVRMKQFDKAQDCFREAWSKAHTRIDAINLNFQNSHLFETMGLSDSALVYHKKYVSLQNETIREILGHPVLGAQKDYYKTLAEAETLRSSRNRRTIALLSVSSILAILMLLFVWRSRKLKLEADKQNLMLAIRELRLKEDSNNDTINQLGRQVNTLFSHQYAELEQVFDKMAELDEKEAIFKSMHRDGKGGGKYQDKAESFYKYIQSRLEELKSDRNQEEIDRIINSTYDNLMQRIMENDYGLSKEDLIILRLSIAGFSVRTISRIVDISPKNIYQKRSRMLAKIERHDSLLSQEIKVKIH